MGGDDSQKLLPWRGSAPLQGANLRLNYEINNVTETAGWNLALTPPSLAGLAVASATGRLGHFWKAEAGQFWRAPKGKRFQDRLELVLRNRAVIINSPDTIPYETQQQRLRKADEYLMDARLTCDLLAAAFFSSSKPKPREKDRLGERPARRKPYDVPLWYSEIGRAPCRE